MVVSPSGWRRPSTDPHLWLVEHPWTIKIPCFLAQVSNRSSMNGTKQFALLTHSTPRLPVTTSLSSHHDPTLFGLQELNRFLLLVGVGVCFFKLVALDSAHWKPEILCFGVSFLLLEPQLFIFLSLFLFFSFIFSSVLPYSTSLRSWHRQTHRRHLQARHQQQGVRLPHQRCSPCRHRWSPTWGRMRAEVLMKYISI